MQLLVIAHRGEAQDFLRHFSLKQDPTFLNLYKSSNLLLLITGEGPFEVLTKLPYVLGKYDISSIINIGIAGSLCEKVKIDRLYKIRTVYAYSNGKPRFESFTAESDSLLDCITTEERVLSSELAKELSPFASIIDREAWAVSKVAKEFKKPITTYKLISDMAGNDTNCFDLKERAKEFSARMLEYYLKNYHDHEVSQKEISPIQYPFHISFTQKKRVEKLISKLNVPIDSLFTAFILLESKTKSQEKERPNNFISFLENKINPINSIIEKRFNTELQSIKDCGAKVIYDKKLDSKKVSVHFDINSQANIDKMNIALSKTKFENIEKIWQGNFDV
jgi:purine-nucleoside phosphorylase